MIQINKKKVLDKWSPILEKMNVSDPIKKEWLAEYAEYHQINENVAYANLGNITGMGAVTSPIASSIPGQTISGATPGSGDYGQQLLPVAMKVAAQTIGLDLVAVKPTPGPVIDLMYVDYRYDDGEASADYNPIMFKIQGSNPTEHNAMITKLKGLLTAQAIKQTSGGLSKRIWVDLDASTSGTGRPAGTIVSGTATTEPAANTDKRGIIEFLGFSRIDGLPMFMAYRTTNASPAGGFTFANTKNTFGETETVVDAFSLTAAGSYQIGGLTSGAVVSLVSALEDQLPQFVGGSKNPMNRAADDKFYPGIIAPNVTTKRVQVGTIEVSSALKRTEIEDIKAQTGIDIVQKLEAVLVNELSQTISKQVVDKVFEMGTLNRSSAPLSVTTNITDGTIFDFDVDAYLSAASAPTGESSQAVQRKLVTKIKNASGYINTEGRVGPATYIVTSHTMAAALTEGANYTLNPVDNTISGNNQLYPMGKVAGISVYVDPYMKYDDKRILVGRKNNPDQPGIIFVPYLMAQSISLISEATFAPRMLLRSRYAVTEVGFFPQKQYMLVNVYDSNNILN